MAAIKRINDRVDEIASQLAAQKTNAQSVREEWTAIESEMLALRHSNARLRRSILIANEPVGSRGGQQGA